MPFFLHELLVPELVYDGKKLAKPTIAKMLQKSHVAQLQEGRVYNLSPKHSDDSFISEVIVFDPLRAIVRLRKRYVQQLANAYSISSQRRVKYIDEPEMHLLGGFVGARTMFPIIDDTELDLLIKNVVSYMESPLVPIRRVYRALTVK